MIKLDMLRTFRVVAQHGTLAAAAEALGRTPSALSMTLSQLEQEVGAPLFETDRKNRLTPLGRLVFEESARATDAFQRSTEAIGRYALSTAGTVRIVTVPSATITVLPAAIAEYRKLRPEVRLEISDADSVTVRQRVQMDEADIGILSAPVDTADVGDVVLRDALGIVCRTGGPISDKAGAGDGSGDCSWDLLGLEPLIANPLCDLVDHDGVRSRLEESRLSARNTAALLSFVQAGLGATILPASALAAGSEGLRFLRPTDPATVRMLIKVRSPQRHPGPAADAFWDVLGDAEP